MNLAQGSFKSLFNKPILWKFIMICPKCRYSVDLRQFAADWENFEILLIDDVSHLLKRSKSMIYLDTNPKSKYYKPDFPKHIKLSERSRGWKAADIYAYIDSLQRKGV